MSLPVPEAEPAGRNRANSAWVRRERVQHAAEDSPVFRNELLVLEEHLDDVQSYTNQLLKSSRNVLQCEMQLLEAKRGFANVVRESTGKFRDDSVNETISSFASMLLDVEEFRSVLNLNVENVFVSPLETFVESEFKRAKELKQQLVNVRKELELVLYKSVSRPNDLEIKQKAKSLRLKFEDINLQYVGKLNELEAKKKTELLDRLTALVEMNDTFHRQAAERSAQMEPLIRKLRGELAASHHELKRDIQLTKNRRDSLNQQLTSTEALTMSVQVEKEGYLFKKTRSKMIADWQRRWFVVRGGILYYLSGAKNTEPRSITNLTFATVRVVQESSSRSHVFQVLVHDGPSASQQSMMLQAESEAEMRNWMQVITNNIAMQLDSSDHSQTASDSLYVKEQLQQLAADQVCVDCGFEAPEWISINLGAFICIECSGIHRSLGSHISKVRSLQLDALNPALIPLMKQLGSRVVNSVYEEMVPASASQPTPKATREVRSQWIHRKYEGREFVRPVELSDALELLRDGCEKNDFVQVYRMLACGANPSHIYPPIQWSCLHYTCAASFADLTLLLLLNGADPNVQNRSDDTPLHVAVTSNCLECVLLLLAHGADFDAVNQNNETALDVAIAMKETAIVKAIEDCLEGDTASSDTPRSERSSLDSPRRCSGHF